ncbi:hypothetical protein [Paenibacillus sp. y28]|uniref:hypothetical protein n=1 Tax=Paenibacillus sp. y28 TaxID=3129110 RepID=UPI00301B5D9B
MIRDEINEAIGIPKRPESEHPFQKKSQWHRQKPNFAAYNPISALEPYLFPTPGVVLLYSVYSYRRSPSGSASAAAPSVRASEPHHFFLRRSCHPLGIRSPLTPLSSPGRYIPAAAYHPAQPETGTDLHRIPRPGDRLRNTGSIDNPCVSTAALAALIERNNPYQETSIHPPPTTLSTSPRYTPGAVFFFSFIGRPQHDQKRKAKTKQRRAGL